MKLVSKHIKKFEQFIQNLPDPNEEEMEDRKEPEEDEIELEPEKDFEDEENEDESDIVDELKGYLERQKNKRKKWKSTI
jgi:hypothetical protein